MGRATAGGFLALLLWVGAMSPKSGPVLREGFGDGEDPRRKVTLSVSPEEDSFLDPDMIQLTAVVTDDTTVNTRPERMVKFLINGRVLFEKMTENGTAQTTFNPKTLQNEKGKVLSSLAGSMPGLLSCVAEVDGFPRSNQVDVRIVQVKFERGGVPIQRIEVSTSISQRVMARVIPNSAKITLKWSGPFAVFGTAPGELILLATQGGATGRIDANIANGKKCGSLIVKTAADDGAVVHIVIDP